jgi:hypothetical protein
MYPELLHGLFYGSLKYQRGNKGRADMEKRQRGPRTFWEKLSTTIGVRLTLGLFFVSALMVLLVSVVVNIHVNRYVKMITEAPAFGRLGRELKPYGEVEGE